MIDAILTAEPYLVAVGLLVWEAFVGWCVWQSVLSDRPISGPVKASAAMAQRSTQRRKAHAPLVPSTSA